MRTIKFSSNGKPVLTKRNVAAVLREAADWLEQNPERHIAGYLYKHNSELGDCHCALGAIDKVCGVKPSDYNEVSKNVLPCGKVIAASGTSSFALDSIWIHVPGDNHGEVRSLWQINDTAVLLNKKKDVIKAMRKRAANLEHGASL
jgi:hypothetical protein